MRSDALPDVVATTRCPQAKDGATRGALAGRVWCVMMGWEGRNTRRGRAFSKNRSPMPRHVTEGCEAKRRSRGSRL